MSEVDAGRLIEQPVSGPVEEQSITPEVRRRLMDQFEQWLDRMSAGEAPPAGLPPEMLAEIDQAPPAEPSCDLYTLFGALTTLTGEIRLQGRAFKHLADTLATVSDLPDRFDRLEQTVAPQAPAAGDLPASSKEICEVLVDLHDRLARGLESCDRGIEALRREDHRGFFRRSRSSRQERHQAVESAQALRDAAAITLARLEAIFDQWGIESIGRVGEPFDPRRMTILHVRPTTDSGPGTVCEVNRSGFALHGQVLATAQVTVSRGESQ